MKRKFVYEVQEFVPPDGSIHLGAYGFGVYLDRGFARKVKDFVLDEVDFVQNRFQEMGEKLIVRRLFRKEGGYIRKPYDFVEDSLLIQSIHVPGNACDLGVAWAQIEDIENERVRKNWLEYNPHNVDSMAQAFALFSLFTKWVDWSKALVNFEDL